MSTRCTIACPGTQTALGHTYLHLYQELLDDCVHLELELDPPVIGQFDQPYEALNLIVPERFVEGVTKILQRAEREAT